MYIIHYTLTKHSNLYNLENNRFGYGWDTRTRFKTLTNESTDVIILNSQRHSYTTDTHHLSFKNNIFQYVPCSCLENVYSKFQCSINGPAFDCRLKGYCSRILDEFFDFLYWNEKKIIENKKIFLFHFISYSLCKLCDVISFASYTTLLVIFQWVWNDVQLTECLECFKYSDIKIEVCSRR